MSRPAVIKIILCRHNRVWICPHKHCFCHHVQLKMSPHPVRNVRFWSPQTWRHPSSTTASWPLSVVCTNVNFWHLGKFRGIDDNNGIRYWQLRFRFCIISRNCSFNQPVQAFPLVSSSKSDRNVLLQNRYNRSRNILRTISFLVKPPGLHYPQSNITTNSWVGDWGCGMLTAANTAPTHWLQAEIWGWPQKSRCLTSLSHYNPRFFSSVVFRLAVLSPNRCRLKRHHAPRPINRLWCVKSALFLLKCFS